MRVLGIDPGTLRTGYGVINSDGDLLKALDWGVIKTSPRNPLPQRLKTIYQELKKIIEIYRPEVASLESVFLADNVKATLKLGQAHGAAILAASIMGLQIEEYSSLQIKQAVTGYGRAEKEQVSRMVCMLLGLPPNMKGGDATDGLAAAICHIHSAAMLNLARSENGKTHS